MKKKILIPALACLALLTSCGAPETYTHSQIRQSFYAPQAKPKVRVMLEGDETDFVSSDQEAKEQMRTAIGEALKEKGWEPTSQIKGSDYVLMCGFTLDDKPIGYTAVALTEGIFSVSENRVFVTRCPMWLKKVNAKGGPGEEVWNGVATNTSRRPQDMDVRTDMAISLIEQQLPSRSNR